MHVQVTAKVVMVAAVFSARRANEAKIVAQGRLIFGLAAGVLGEPGKNLLREQGAAERIVLACTPR